MASRGCSRPRSATRRSWATCYSSRRTSRRRRACSRATASSSTTARRAVSLLLSPSPLRCSRGGGLGAAGRRAESRHSNSPLSAAPLSGPKPAPPPLPLPNANRPERLPPAPAHHGRPPAVLAAGVMTTPSPQRQPQAPSRPSGGAAACGRPLLENNAALNCNPAGARRKPKLPVTHRPRAHARPGGVGLAGPVIWTAAGVISPDQCFLDFFCIFLV